MLKRELVLFLVIAVLVDLGKLYLAIRYLRNLRVTRPLNVAVTKLGFHQALGITNAVEAEMSDIGFGRHEMHRYAVSNLSFL